MFQKYFRLLALLAAAPLAAQAQTGNVGIGITQPTQKLDVNGNLRVRGLSGTDNRLPVVLPDGTLGVNAPVFGSSANTATPIPAAPTGTVNTGQSPTGVAVNGTKVYEVNQGNSVLQIFDAANPASPVLLGSVYTDINPDGVAVSGTTAYVTNYSSQTLQTFNVANPASPVVLGSVQTFYYPLSVTVSGTLAYVAEVGALEIVNVANPARPVVVGGVTQPTEFYSVAVSGTTAYAVTSNNTLLTYNVADPANPVLISSVSTASGSVSVAVSGITVYVVGGGTLQAFSTANPGSPALLSTVPTGGGSTSLALSGSRAYVASGSAVQVFDVANPASPVLLGSVPTGGTLTGLAVSNSTAYVTNTTNSTLQVITFSSVPPDRVVTVSPTGSLASVALPGAADFVQNQTATSQRGGFSVSGTGTVGALTAGSASVGGLLTAGSATVSGNVGIGTSTPGQKLEVNGGIKFTGTGSALTFPDGTTQTTASTNTSGILNQTTRQAGANFNIAGNGSIGGNLGIGTTTTPAAKLTVQPASNADVGLRVTNGVADGSAISGNIVLQTLTGSNSGFSFLGFNGANDNLNEVRYGTSKNRWRLGTDQRGSTDEFFVDTYNGSGTSVLRLSTAGNVGIGAAPNASYRLNVGGDINATGQVRANGVAITSDRRFKQNIRPLTSALAGVLALRGVRYDWNALGIQHGGKAGAPQVGLIAQELEAVYPELVSTGPDGYKAVNYAQLAPVLIEALKELKAENDALKQEAAAAKADASSAKAQAAQATATLETFEARLRRLEAATGGQAQR